ncbi:MAG: hypothetical protein IKF19_04555 [Bacilli bacterium]|nr:hypothetical protein [Bacilli bacterium]
MDKYDSLFKKKIPKGNTLDMWEKYDFVNSSFIEIPSVIKMDGKSKIIVDLQYPKIGMKNAIDRCLVRKEVLERLLIACTYLPDNLSFKIWDAYRPWKLQNELYYVYKPEIIKKFKLVKLSDSQQEKIISNYVSIPSKNSKFPPLHTTGGSIDLTITDLKEGNDLDFAVKFDEFSDLASTDYFENNSLNVGVKYNRRLLYNVMAKAGFTNLPSEVWHYDYGNRAWGYYVKKPAIYEGVFDISKELSIISFADFIDDLKKDNLKISLNKHKWEYYD